MNPRSASLDSLTTFGDLLKYLRRRARLTQRELATAVGFSESQISRLEANLRTPDRASLMALFVPALSLQGETETIARLLELAQHDRSQAEPHPAAIGPERTHLHNLPIQLTSFIGHGKEIAALRKHLISGPSRLVTLIGAGGVGKTRLALRVAEELLGDFEDGVWLVELAAISNPELLPQAVASGLAIEGSMSTALSEVLTSYLRNSRLLLVLDDCEHLVQACAGLVDRLLRVCPRLVILCTSREALRVDGEQAYYVPSLAVPDPNRPQPVEELAQYEAVRLFTDRATASWGSFEITAQNAPVVVQICRRLDGIPLAIELAASRVGAMSVEQIQARLAQSYHLLSAGPRLALPRHQTLRASIDWSYHLLEDKEQLLLRRLSVFPGGWTLEAAEAVCGFGPIASADVLDLLTSLVAKSLVHVTHETSPGPGSTQAATTPRYRMLETIRQYASERLAGEKVASEVPAYERVAGEGPPDSDPVDELRRRHLAYYARLIEPAAYELLGPKQIAWVELLTAELGNIRAALDWSLLGQPLGDRSPQGLETGLKLANAPLYFWYFFGRGEEAYAWLSAGLQALTQQASPPALLLGRTYKTAAVSLYTMGDVQKSREYWCKSIALLRPLGWSYDLAEALSWLVFVGPSQATDAKALQREAVEVARQVGDAGLLGVCLWIGSSSHREMEEAARVLEKNGDVLFLADPNRVRAVLAEMDGDYAFARRCLQRTLATNQEHSMRMQIAWDWRELAELAYHQGRYGQMETEAQASLDAAAEISFRHMVAWSLYYLGVAARRLGHVDQASDRFERGLALAREYGFERLALQNLAGLAGIALERGRLAVATRLLGMVECREGHRAEQVTGVEFERDRGTVRSLLPDADFLSAWEEGRAMTIDQALEHVL